LAAILWRLRVNLSRDDWIISRSKRSVSRQRHAGTRFGVLCPPRVDMVIGRWKRRPNMLLMSTMTWVAIGVGVAILAGVIGVKIKDKYL
jgi:hypothetical protein